MELTITELQERLAECNEYRKDYTSNYVFAYDAEAQYIETTLEDREEGNEYDEGDRVRWLENILEDHMEYIYEDWYKSEDNIYWDEEGNWKKGTSGYQWMLWALDTEVYEFHQRMVSYAEDHDLDIPQWYQDEYMDW